jgi:hypothetical protein
MAAIVLTCGSLIPAMILHALIDAGGGLVGYLLLRDYPLAAEEHRDEAFPRHSVQLTEQSADLSRREA